LAATTVETWVSWNANGVPTTTTSSFSTLTPSKTDRPTDNLADNNPTYGVGMIISVDYHQAVVNKAAALQAITVENSDNPPVKGHWFNDDNWLDLRPETYWKPGTKVTITYYRGNNQRTADLTLAQRPSGG